MKRLTAALSILSSLLFFSCEPKEEPAPQEPDSKNSATELTISACELSGPWAKGDAVSVLDSKGNHRFSAKEEGSPAVFIGLGSTGVTERIVLSPVNSAAKFDKDSIKVDIPATQREFQPVSAACGESTSFAMKAACAALSFTTTTENISKVEIEPAAEEKLAGYIKLSFNGKDGGMVLTPRGSDSRLTLLPASGSSSVEPGAHRVICIPGSFTSGLKATVTYSNGASRLFENTAVSSVSVGEILDLGTVDEGELVEPEPGGEPDPQPEPEPTPEPEPDPVPTGDAVPQDPARTEAFDIDLVFLDAPDATAFQWPFASPAVNAISSSYGDKASFPGKKTEFTLTDEKGGYKFQVFGTTGIAKNSGGHQGLKFGGAEGDYMQFPAIKGLTLTKVTWVTGGTNAAGASIVRYDGASVAGGEARTTNFSAIGDSHIWNLYGAKQETAYRLRIGTGSAFIQQLKLHYDTAAPEDPASSYQEVLPDQIPDFSRVGYRWGDKPIPDIPVKMTLEAPSDGSDALDLIQNAINTVETPGAILLKAGTYNISNIVRITRSGVVLRGEGEGKTILYSTATTQQGRLLQMGATNKFSPGAGSLIIAKYVPVGQMWVPVRNPEMFSVGETVWIYRPATEAWLDALHMREIAQNSDNSVVQWTTAAYSIYWERKIMKIEGDKIWFDNPVVMCIGGDSRYGVGYLCKGSWSRVEECGIENMTLDTRYDATKKSGEDFIDEEHCWSGIAVYAAEHGWVRNVTTRHFGYCSVDLTTGAKNITVKDCTSLSPVSVVTGGNRYAFHFSKSQLCLFEGCHCDDDRHQYVCGSQVPGPNVFLRCTSTNARSDAGPHQRWASGTLYDNIKVSGALNIQDRAGYGTGHGWTGVNFVCWNCETASICVQSPWATGQNWAIGCTGNKVAAARSYSDKLGARPDGIWQSPGVHVSPESLYESQLAERHARGEYIAR